MQEVLSAVQWALISLCKYNQFTTHKVEQPASTECSLASICKWLPVTGQSKLRNAICARAETFKVSTEPVLYRSIFCGWCDPWSIKNAVKYFLTWTNGWFFSYCYHQQKCEISGSTIPRTNPTMKISEKFYSYTAEFWFVVEFYTVDLAPWANFAF